jgi:transposase
MEIPGVGPLLASALVATIADPKAFKSGRNLAAWIGLVPRQNSSGGKERLGGISATLGAAISRPLSEGQRLARLVAECLG